MAKYIDVDKLKAEIERRKDIYIGHALCLKETNLIDGFDEALNIIESLQQEQPEQKKECNDCPHCIDRKDQYGWHFKGCFGGPYRGKFIAEIDECPLEQEQQKVDLEKFTQKMNDWKARYNHPDNIPIRATMAFTARMFYMYPNVAREWYDSLPKVTQD